MSKSNLESLLELANLYPSPHNGQPIRLKLLSDDSFELYFQKERGLQAADISFIFSFVSMGVFVEHLSLAAQALGHNLSYRLTLPAEAELRGQGTVKFGTAKIIWNSAMPDNALLETIQFRQTSRKKYSAGIAPELSKHLSDTAREAKMLLKQLSDAQAKQAIWLNQRAVFDDMFDEPVRQELNHWLRYSKKQKQTTKDGLAYDCMELSGPAMKFIVAHPGVLHAPGVSWLLKQYYLRTMSDSSNVFYMMAPFSTGQDAFNAGVTIMDLWRKIAASGYYLHPFGTIMSNHAAHQDFLELAQQTNETREMSYLVFIFRAGKSDPPVRSLRLSYNDHLVME